MPERHGECVAVVRDPRRELYRAATESAKKMGRS
jgi:hypothetical protein